MTRFLTTYVRWIDRMNRRVGRVAMYGIFVMMAILLYSSSAKIMETPSLWTLEMAQFAMVAYYILGGPYSIQLGSNVRMDLFYGAWRARTKSWVDSITVLFLIFFLIILLWGGISSTAYSLGSFSGEPFAFFGDLFAAFVTGGPDAAAEELGHMERAPTAWRPYLWPIKSIMVIGIFLMLLQAVSELFKDILRIKGHDI